MKVQASALLLALSLAPGAFAQHETLSINPDASQVTFAASSYQGTLAASGDSTIQASGVFTLHGTPHDLTLSGQVTRGN